MRVVSLLPSATEVVRLLAGPGPSRIGLVGRSHECDFPEDVKRIPAITSQRTAFSPPQAVDREVGKQAGAGQSLCTLDTRMLAALKPDLILTQDLGQGPWVDLETVRRAAGAMAPAPEILAISPRGFEDALDDILRIGEALGLESEARLAVTGLRARAFRAQEYVPAFAPGPSAAFLEWTDPLRVAGHWTAQLIERAGASYPLNPTAPQARAGAAAGPMQSQRLAGGPRWVEPEALVASAPEVLIICPRGMDLARTRAAAAAAAEQAWFGALPAVRAGRVALVDGSQFHRPGPRLVDALEWLVAWLHGRPELMPPGFAWEPWEG
ncbi:MAG: ABC transporter substrate-binding protein [Phycisphaerales bacterium JB039]